MHLPWYVTCALVHGNINAKKKVPACVHACQIRQKNTDIGAAKVGPATAGLAGPVPPPLTCRHAQAKQFLSKINFISFASSLLVENELDLSSLERLTFLYLF